MVASWCGSQTAARYATIIDTDDGSEERPDGEVAARASGRLGGCPKGLPRKAESPASAAETLYREGRLSTQDIAHKLHISLSTQYAYLRVRGVPIRVSRGQPGLPPATTLL